MLKSLLVAVLTLGLLFCFIACDSADQQEKMTDSMYVNDGETGGPVEKSSYMITIVDEDNRPVPGVLLQMCLESCIPNKTDANGKAEFFSLPEGEYKVSLMSIPEGYDYATEEREWYFSNGENEMVIVLATKE